MDIKVAKAYSAVKAVKKGDVEAAKKAAKEADEYIEKMKAENKDFDISIESKTDGKKVKKIIIETEKETEN